MSEHKKNGWNPSGFYPTPHSVCEMMTQMTFDPGTDNRAKTVCDPAGGTGRMLLHASNHSLRLYAQDIDPMAVMACKINLALYAPWGLWGLPDGLFEAVDLRRKINQLQDVTGVLAESPSRLCLPLPTPDAAFPVISELPPERPAVEEENIIGWQSNGQGTLFGEMLALTQEISNGTSKRRRR